jgi:hypothetical protein
MKNWTVIAGYIISLWLLILFLPSFIEVLVGFALLGGLLTVLSWLNERKARA